MVDDQKLTCERLRNVTFPIWENNNPSAHGFLTFLQKEDFKQKQKNVGPYAKKEEKQISSKKSLIITPFIDACFAFSIGSIYDNYAYFHCRTSYWEIKQQELHLEKVIGNNEGKMVRGSNYYNSCKSFSMSTNGVLSGKCKNGQGKYLDTSFDLKKNMSWKNDKLTKIR